MRLALPFILLATACTSFAQKPAKPDVAPEDIVRVEMEIAGWTWHVDERLLSEDDAEAKAIGDAALALAAADLHRIPLLIHPDVAERLRTIEFVLDLNCGDLRPAQYHPSAGWLKENGFTTDLARKVHIPVAAGYAGRDHLFQQPAVLLHELSHAYHDQFLDFENPLVVAAFKAAKESGNYDEHALHISGRRRPHYGMTNHKEYFAECTEAFLYVNDFFPFVRAELRRHDPPVTAALKRIWIDGEIPTEAPE